MYGMYMINEYTGQNQGRQEETLNPTHTFRRLFLDLLLMGWRGCVSAMGVVKTPHLPVLVRKPSCKQFIHNQISSRCFWYQSFHTPSCCCRCNRMFVFETVDRGSRMSRLHRWSVMIYRSLQAEFMETKYNSHIHRYGTSIFAKIAVYTS